jgi:hypothetical protein
MTETKLDETTAGAKADGHDVPQIPVEIPPPTPEEAATPEILNAIVQGYNPDCKIVDSTAELGTAVGDNYMSIMYAIKMKLKNQKTGSEETLEVMLKTMPRNMIRQQMINDCGAFIKDSKMYNEVSLLKQDNLLTTKNTVFFQSTELG